MLFHIVLAPWVGVDVVRGAKWASGVFAGVALVTVYWCLLRHGVRRPEWWVIGMLACAPDFLFRLEMPRVQALSLVCLLVQTELLRAGRYAVLLPLATVFTWLYDGFALLLLVAGGFTAALAAVERRAEWRPVIYTSAGIAVGLVVNPYFPHDLLFIWQHYMSKVDGRALIHAGSEWRPYHFAKSLGWEAAVLVMAAAGVGIWRFRRQLDTNSLAAVLVAGVFLLLMWRSRRFIEYAAPFVTIALALLFHAALDERFRALRAAARWALATILLIACGFSTSSAVTALRQRPPADRYAGCAAWLASHTPPGSIVFTPDWDDFPLLFFHNQHNRYVIGLDPSYLEQRNPELYHLWRASVVAS